jgi:hypothetical protein
MQSQTHARAQTSRHENEFFARTYYYKKSTETAKKKCAGGGVQGEGGNG